MSDDIDKKNEEAAEKWFRNQIGWYMSGGCDQYPHTGKTTSTADEHGMVRRFHGGHAHDEGGESIEIKIAFDDGLWELSRSTYSRDCDGPLDRHWEATIDNGKIVDEDSHQRDHYAESMGY